MHGSCPNAAGCTKFVKFIDSAYRAVDAVAEAAVPDNPGEDSPDLSDLALQGLRHQKDVSTELLATFARVGPPIADCTTCPISGLVQRLKAQ
jgi:hypothetical protein